MSVSTAVETALYTQLTGGTALIAALGGTAIYALQAPDGSLPPFVVFTPVAGQPDNDTPSDMRSVLYQVRCYSGSKATAASLDALVSARLHRQTLSVTGYTNFWTVRESDSPALVENLPNNVKTYSYGGYYRIRLDN